MVFQSTILVFTDKKERLNFVFIVCIFTIYFGRQDIPILGYIL